MEKKKLSEMSKTDILAVMQKLRTRLQSTEQQLAQTQERVRQLEGDTQTNALVCLNQKCGKPLSPPYQFCMFCGTRAIQNTNNPNSGDGVSVGVESQQVADNLKEAWKRAFLAEEAHKVKDAKIAKLEQTVAALMNEKRFRDEQQQNGEKQGDDGEEDDQNEKEAEKQSSRDREKALANKCQVLSTRILQLQLEAQKNAEAEGAVERLTREVESLKAVVERERSQKDIELEVESAERERERQTRDSERAEHEREKQRLMATFQNQIADLTAAVQLKQQESNELAQQLTQLGAVLEQENNMSQDKDREIQEMKQAMLESQAARERELLQLEARHSDKYEKLLGELKMYKEKSGKITEEATQKAKSLRARVTELEDEIATGKPAERRLFELAELQARRDDLVNRSHSQIEDLKRQLSQRQQEFTEAVGERDFLREQLTRLESSQSRAGVDLEYLKNILVRFMSFEEGDPQRVVMVDVMAKLLKFSPEDRALIDKRLSATTKKTSGWFG